MKKILLSKYNFHYTLVIFIFSQFDTQLYERKGNLKRINGWPSPASVSDTTTNYM